MRIPTKDLLNRVSMSLFLLYRQVSVNMLYVSYYTIYFSPIQVRLVVHAFALKNTIPMIITSCLFFAVKRLLKLCLKLVLFYYQLFIIFICLLFVSHFSVKICLLSFSSLSIFPLQNLQQAFSYKADAFLKV